MKANKTARSFEEFQVLWKNPAREESMMTSTSHTSVGLEYFGSRDKKRPHYPSSEASESKIEQSLERRLESQQIMFTELRGVCGKEKGKTGSSTAILSAVQSTGFP